MIYSSRYIVLHDTDMIMRSPDAASSPCDVPRQSQYHWKTHSQKAAQDIGIAEPRGNTSAAQGVVDAFPERVARVSGSLRAERRQVARIEEMVFEDGMDGVDGCQSAEEQDDCSLAALGRRGGVRAMRAG